MYKIPKSAASDVNVVAEMVGFILGLAFSWGEFALKAYVTLALFRWLGVV